jgi:hypothetical protein
VFTSNQFQQKGSTMLIEFKSKGSASVLMFGDVAKSLIRMMGHTGTIPSSIAAPDVANALEKLRAALAVENQASEAVTQSDDEIDDQAPAPVSLAKRAVPLVQMLDKAAKQGDFVSWDVGE